MAQGNAEHTKVVEQQVAPGGVEKDEKKGSACELGGCCAVVSGPGGKLRLALLIALAIVVVALLVYGFATA